MLVVFSTQLDEYHLYLGNFLGFVASMVCFQENVFPGLVPTMDWSCWKHRNFSGQIDIYQQKLFKSVRVRKTLTHLMIKIWGGFFTTHITIPNRWIPYEFMFEKKCIRQICRKSEFWDDFFRKKLTLWWTNIAMEAMGHRNRWFTYYCIAWWFSIVMFNYQRVNCFSPRKSAWFFHDLTFWGRLFRFAGASKNHCHSTPNHLVERWGMVGVGLVVEAKNLGILSVTCGIIRAIWFYVIFAG